MQHFDLLDVMLTYTKQKKSLPSLVRQYLRPGARRFVHLRYSASAAVGEEDCRDS